jgi:general secretion pathway protein H
VARRLVSDDVGLTLLEMLIVLAVIAIATGATLLSFGSRRGDPVEVEARRLAATIAAATDRSIATGNEAAIITDPHGYTVTGAIRHELASDLELRGAVGTSLPLTLDAARPFDLIVAHGATAWRVAFDGVRASAAAAKDPA